MHAHGGDEAPRSAATGIALREIEVLNAGREVLGISLEPSGEGYELSPWSRAAVFFEENGEQPSGLDLEIGVGHEGSPWFTVSSDACWLGIEIDGVDVGAVERGDGRVWIPGLTVHVDGVDVEIELPEQRASWSVPAGRALRALLREPPAFTGTIGFEWRGRGSWRTRSLCVEGASIVDDPARAAGPEGE